MDHNLNVSGTHKKDLTLGTTKSGSFSTQMLWHLKFKLYRMKIQYWQSSLASFFLQKHFVSTTSFASTAFKTVEPKE